VRRAGPSPMILVEQNLDFIAALSQRILIIQKRHDHPRKWQPRISGDASLSGIYQSPPKPDPAGVIQRETKARQSGDPHSIIAQRR